MGGKVSGPAADISDKLMKYARIERERKFVLTEFPPGLSRTDKHVQIFDNYITNTRMRLRYIRIPYTKEIIRKLTQKYPVASGDLSRTIITNIYLSRYEYDVLSVFEANEIRKNRYPYEYDGRQYSIDVFLGGLWGLILAETSFDTDEEMEAFEMPPFAFSEVTNDEMFTGAKLVDLTFDEIESKLQLGSQAVQRQ